MSAMRLGTSILHRAVQALFNYAPLVFRLLRLLPLPERLWRHLYFTGPIKISVSRNQAFWMRHHGYRIENDLFWQGFGNGWEGTSLRLWCLLAARAETILDIGANTGVYALAAKSCNPRAQVYAFEPVQRIFDKLEQNIQLNHMNIKASPIALSDTTGTATLFDAPREHMYSASLDAEMLAGDPDIVGIPVATFRLRDFADQNELDSVDLVKIDTEKHEQSVLEGFGEMLERDRPVVLVEILDREHGNSLRDFFPGDAYRYYEIEELRGCRRVEALGEGSRNFLLCPHSVAEQFNFQDYIPHGVL